MKVEITHNTRYGMGESYHEKYYRCPKCHKEIMYYNGVIQNKNFVIIAEQCLIGAVLSYQLRIYLGGTE